VKPKARKRRRVSEDSQSEKEESALSDPPSAESQDEESEAEKTPPPAKKAVKARAKPVKKAEESKAAPKTARGTKRKVIDSDDEQEENDESAPADKQTTAEIKKDNDEVGDTPLAPKSENEDVEHTVRPAAAMVAPKQEPAQDGASESEMSILIDEEPPPKKKRQKKTPGEKTVKTKAPKPSNPSKKAKEVADVSSDDSEIKRLQGWLVKCGIRKLWGKELKPYTTPKAKITHLKSMLSEAGMEGRYSVEKARSIKEKRELAADLEAVQEFGKRWGEDKDANSDDDESDGDARSKKRVAASRVANWGIDSDLLGSDGGEETD